MTRNTQIEAAYAIAREQFATMGVDTERAIERLGSVAISLQCWQGDDVTGLDNPDADLGGGLAATGNYPGKARNGDELRADLDKALSLIPGKHRLNLHASYAETGGERVDRDALEPRHFSRWFDWVAERGMGMDFNPTCFSHPKAEDGFTVSHADPAIRRFWVDHGIACRHIGAAAGQRLGVPCVTNFWFPDGAKDSPADRKAPRERLLESLDAIFVEKIDPAHNLDAVESKLFGIGSESYVVGSYDFFLPYAVSRGKLLCFDTGHYHPTEVVSDKLSAVFNFVDEILLHVSRGVRWDSDHVVSLSDETRAIAIELVRGDFLDRTHIGLDFFDASINRIAAWVIGTRNMLRALMIALLEPTDLLREMECAGDLTGRLAWNEETLGLPWGAVWDYYCLKQDAPVGVAWLDEVRAYEKDVLLKRA